jgi:hypothetical protein
MLLIASFCAGAEGNTPSDIPAEAVVPSQELLDEAYPHGARDLPRVKEQMEAMMEIVMEESIETSVKALNNTTAILMAFQGNGQPGYPDAQLYQKRVAVHPRLQKLLWVAENGSEAQKQELQDAVYALCDRMLNEWPVKAETAAPAIEHAGDRGSILQPGLMDAVAVPLIIAALDVDAADKLALVNRLHLRWQEACVEWDLEADEAPEEQWSAGPFPYHCGWAVLEIAAANPEAIGAQEQMTAEGHAILEELAAGYAQADDPAAFVQSNWRKALNALAGKQGM